MLATLLVEPPPSLTAVAQADRTVDLQWDTSPTAASRPVVYLVLRRPSGGAFAEVARTDAITFTDTPPSGTFDYAVQCAVSTFTSANSPMATATTPP